ncbi:hypothetical protein VTN77DRAFT_1672 [Rasamsonia byssochlamydoides]|uniref:uncharacterized protein n=1 Tax=Rasamsonia byssochlamydoides TaxID=89139 RepID=UPI0037431DD0
MAIENLQPLTYAVISVAFAVGTLSIFLRLYCRAFLLKTFGLDDAVAIFLLLVNSMQQSVLYIFLHYGCGLHVTLLNEYQIDNITKWLFIEEIWYMFTHWTMKQAFLFFYLRLSQDKVFQRLVYGTMVLNTAFTIINWLLAFLQCRPFAAILHRADYPDAKCIDSYVLLMGPSVLNIITDVIILTLPIKTVLSLQMSTRRKVAVLSVISFGGSAVIIALCRFIILKQLAVNPDISYVLGKMIIVAALEIEFAIVAVNLPGMKPLWKRITGGSTHDSGNPSAGVYKLSSHERGTGTGRKIGELSRSRKASNAHELTQTGSEEELIYRATKGHIQVTTNVDVSTAAKRPEDDQAQLGLQSYSGRQIC